MSATKEQIQKRLEKLFYVQLVTTAVIFASFAFTPIMVNVLVCVLGQFVIGTASGKRSILMEQLHE